MSPHFKAVLHGNRIEWVDPPPDHQQPASIYITFADFSISSSRGTDMADSLQDLSREGGLSTISDPIAWQRDIRDDRSLPLREV